MSKISVGCLSAAFSTTYLRLISPRSRMTGAMCVAIAVAGLSAR